MRLCVLLTARWVAENGRVWYNMRPINMSNKWLLLGRENARMGYSAAYPAGAERCLFYFFYCGFWFEDFE